MEQRGVKRSLDGGVEASERGGGGLFAEVPGDGDGVVAEAATKARLTDGGGGGPQGAEEAEKTSVLQAGSEARRAGGGDGTEKAEEAEAHPASGVAEVEASCAHGLGASKECGVEGPKVPRGEAAPRTGGIEVCTAPLHSEDWAKRVVQDQAFGAGVARDFLRDEEISGGQELREWARRLCAVGEQVKDELLYWESYRARPGEDAAVQFRRELKEDFEDMIERLHEEGAADAAAQVTNDRPGLEALCALVDRLMQIFVSGSTAGTGAGGGLDEERRFFHLRIDINQEGPTKFHDDDCFSALRLVLPLVGEGPVLAGGDCVDWNARSRLVGALTDAFEAESLRETEAEQHIRAWNASICPPERETAVPPGSLVVMKGGVLAECEQRCLFRCPYGQGRHSFLITLEHLTKEDMERSISMNLTSDGEEDQEDDEDGQEVFRPPPFPLTAAPSSPLLDAAPSSPPRLLFG